VDWLTFIAAMTKALAWPLTAMAAVSAISVFREPIGKLIGRIVTMKASPVSVKTKVPTLDPKILSQIQEIATHLAAADRGFGHASIGNSRFQGPAAHNPLHDRTFG
jgi:hypothetical protein